MKPGVFAYKRAGTPEEAVELVRAAGDDARFIAGGQSLMPVLNLRMDAPGLLVDISRLETLRGVGVEGETLRIGALTTHSEVLANPHVRRHAPLIAAALREVAHPAIRNRGTFGGSIALADPAAEMPACALAMGARMHILGTDGAREVEADDYFLGLYETALDPGELLTGVAVPIPPSGTRHGFAELARRRGDYAMAGLAMLIGPKVDTRPAWARIVFFGISDRPVRSLAAEAAVCAGDDPDRCAAVATDGIDVFGDASTGEATKRHYAAVLLKRELDRLAKEEAA